MACSECYHSFYTGNPGDDLEAACNCDCHDSFSEDEDICSECDYSYADCTCYGDKDE